MAQCIECAAVDAPVDFGYADAVTDATALRSLSYLTFIARLRDAQACVTYVMWGFSCGAKLHRSPLAGILHLSGPGSPTSGRRNSSL